MGGSEPFRYHVWVAERLPLHALHARFHADWSPFGAVGRALIPQRFTRGEGRFTTLHWHIQEGRVLPRRAVEEVRYAIVRRGMVRIPQAVMAQAGISPGSLVMLCLEGDRIVVRRVEEDSEAQAAAPDPRWP